MGSPTGGVCKRGVRWRARRCEEGVSGVTPDFGDFGVSFVATMAGRYKRLW